MSLKEKISAKLEAMDPAKRQKVILVGGTTAFLVLMSAIVLITDDSGNKPKKKVEEVQSVGNLLMGTPSREIGLTGVSNDLRALQDRMAEMERENQRLKDAEAKREKQSADQALAQLSEQVGSERTAVAPPGTMLNPVIPDPPQRQVVLPNLPRNNGPVAPPPPPVAPEIHTTRSAKPKVSRAVERLKNVYLPTGAIMSGVLLNGLDAPTGRMAQGSPIPVVVRVKHEAILPSQYSSDVREAFILAAGYGDLSSERAYLRAERFSMILRNGEVVDIPIKMSAVGNDGKSGLRGRVVSKQGAVIGKALLAGMADGVSRAFGGRTSSFGQGNDLPDDRDVMVSGVGGGTTGALDRIAAYFLSQAEAMYPVVEIDGGRPISFILLEGTELAPRVIEEEDIAETSAESDAEAA